MKKDTQINTKGGKACWLDQICQKMGQDIVPAYYVIDTGKIAGIMEAFPSYDTIVTLLGQIRRNRVLCRRNLSMIRKKILESRIPKTCLEGLLLQLEAAHIDLKEGVSVRSSSMFEDNRITALAGVFKSTLHVSSLEDLERAVLETIASGFSEVAYHYAKNDEEILRGMAVIVQQMCKGKWYGVLFTRNPMNAGEALLELSDYFDDVVNGKNPAIRISFTREQKEKDWDYGDITAIDPLLEILQKAEELCSGGADMELVIREDGGIRILQCRPITKGRSEDPAPAVIDQDEIEKYGHMDLGKCEALFQKFLGKQYIFRKAVSELGYELYRQYYVCYRTKDLSPDTMERILAGLRTENLLVEFGSGDRVFCTRQNLESLLERRAENTDEAVWCRIGEVIVAEFSGYSSLTEEGDVLIEYVPGRMQGLLGGTCEPVRLILSPVHGCTVLANPRYERIESVDPESGKRIWVKYGKCAEAIPEECIGRIHSYTAAMTERFGNSRLEWYLYQNQLFGKDISIEGEGLAFAGRNANIISPGYAQGYCYRFSADELEELDCLAQEYDLSLYSHTETEDRIYDDLRFCRRMEALAGRGEKLIGIADRPSLGLMAVACRIEGFVFVAGSVLSHVGIFLRENKIPAVIDENAGGIEEGTKIRITPTGMEKCNG